MFGVVPRAGFLGVTVVCLVVTGAACTSAGNETNGSGPGPTRVERTISGRATVVDGDGLEIGGTKIRLFGVDAPETDQYCRRKDGTRWRCGHYASAELDRLVAGHDVVCSVRDVDRYERSVAVCKVGTTDLGESQARAGWALAYRQFSRDYSDEEDEARSAQRGVWQGEFEMPWAWRARTRERR